MTIKSAATLVQDLKSVGIEVRGYDAAIRMLCHTLHRNSFELEAQSAGVRELAERGRAQGVRLHATEAFSPMDAMRQLSQLGLTPSDAERVAANVGSLRGQPGYVTSLDAPATTEAAATATKFHEFTRAFLDAIAPKSPVHLEPHDDRRGSDIVWLSFTAAEDPDQADDEGTSLVISPWAAEEWRVGLFIDYPYGGAALVQEWCGMSGQLLPLLINDLEVYLTCLRSTETPMDVESPPLTLRETG
ncbi:MAG: hypothetical protein VB135_00410 [Burkholderia sp.]